MTAGSPTVGLQRWRQLLFVHWSVPIERLRPLVPDALTLDTFEGRAYVGLIPFRMEGVRPLRRLPPVPTATAFLESNARTYVTCNGVPGIYFFALDAQSSLAVLGARAAFGLPYFRARMAFEQDGAELRYQLERLWPRPRAALDLRYQPGESIGIARPGTLEHFLVERYSLFSVRRSGRVQQVDVRHSPYPLCRATVHAVEESVLAAAGVDLSGCERTPDLYSGGVDVEIAGARSVS